MIHQLDQHELIDVLLLDAYLNISRWLCAADRLGQLENLEWKDESTPPHKRF